MISFVTFFLGLVIGVHPVQIAVSAEVASVEMRVDGRVVGVVRADPWTIKCDFGDELLPHELVATAFGHDGRTLATVRQWINMPRPDAEVSVTLERDDLGRPLAARVTTETLVHDEIPRVTATLDGNPLTVENPHRILLPDFAPDAAHVLVVSVDFGDGIEASDQVAFGGFHGSEFSTELTAVPVDVEKGNTLPSVNELQSRFEVNGKPVRVLGVERNQAQVVIVRDGGIDPAAAWSTATRRQLAAGREPFGTLNEGDRIRVVSPFADPRDRSGLEVILFPISRWFRGQSIPRILAGLPPPSIKGLERTIADAIAVAGVEAARGNHPRAVVLCLGKSTKDDSIHDPNEVRRFLDSLRVPLFVWRWERKENPDWPNADYVAFYTKLTNAVARLRRALDSQRIVWIEGRHLPQTVRMADESEPLRLVGGLEGPYPSAGPPGDESTELTGPPTLANGTPTFAGEVEVVVVNVEAFVRDRNGTPVEDLNRDDFQLVVDGVETPLSHFSCETGPGITEPENGVAAPIEKTEEALPSHLILFVDNQNLAPFSRRRVLDETRRFVVENVGSTVEMMVVERQLGLEVAQPFTDNANEIVTALDRLRNDTGGIPVHEALRRSIFTEIEMCNSLDRGRGSCLESVRIRAERAAFEERLRVLKTIRDLGVAVESLGGLDGRKALVYVSNGLPMIAGLDLVHSVVDPIDLARLRSTLDCSREVEALAETSLRSGVNLYAIDAAGLEAPEGVSAESRTPVDNQFDFEISSNRDAAILYLAHATGGQAVVNTNRFASGLDRIRDDFFSYYSIAFTVPASRRDISHRVEIRLPRHKDLKVRHRDVIYEKSAETRARETVIAGLMKGESENPIEMDVVQGEAVQKARDVIQVPLKISVPIANISLAPDEDEGHFKGDLLAFVACKGKGGRTSEIFREAFPVVIPAGDLTQAIRQVFTIEFSILVKADDESVSLAVADPASGFVSYSTFQPRPPHRSDGPDT